MNPVRVLSAQLTHGSPPLNTSSEQDRPICTLTVSQENLADPALLGCCTQWIENNLFVFTWTAQICVRDSTNQVQKIHIHSLFKISVATSITLYFMSGAKKSPKFTLKADPKPFLETYCKWILLIWK